MSVARIYSTCKHPLGLAFLSREAVRTLKVPSALSSELRCSLISFVSQRRQITRVSYPGRNIGEMTSDIARRKFCTLAVTSAPAPDVSVGLAALAISAIRLPSWRSRPGARGSAGRAVRAVDGRA